MNKQKELIPELRFPAFEKSKNWVERRLVDFDDLPSGDGDWILSKDISQDGEFKIVQLSSIGFGVFKEKDLKTITEEKFKELNGTRIQKGDILINRMVDSEKINCCIFPRDGNYVTSVDVCWIRENNSFLNYFLMSLLCTGANQIKLLKLSSGAGRVRISKKNLFEQFIFQIPENHQEQQKIAEFLSTLDELIVAHNEKLEALKDHKKGLLQNLFPQEGETEPKIRFPEFEKDGEWDLIQFSDSIKLYRGSSPRPIKQFRTESDDGVNWIKIGDTGSEDDHVISKVEEKITKEGAKKSREVWKGELILANSMSYGRTYLLELDGYIYDGWFVLREYENDFDKQFLLQILNSDYMQEQYEKFAAGGIVKNISSKIVYDTMLPKPSKKEQQKIASFLSIIDKLISEQINKIEELQQHKKGLMQGLFPKVKG
jgi:type I restriction enzyme S subunit